MTSKKEHQEPDLYKIQVSGKLNNHWQEWCEGMTITHEDESTILIGQISDQAALYGILNRIRDLNLTLLLVEKL